MAHYNFTQIDWENEFLLDPALIIINAQNQLEIGDEVTIRFTAVEVEKYTPISYSRARLVPAKPKHNGWWQRLNRLIGCKAHP